MHLRGRNSLLDKECDVSICKIICYGTTILKAAAQRFPRTGKNTPNAAIPLTLPVTLFTVKPSCRPSPFSAGSEPVTKKEIVKQISEALGLTQLKTKEIVQKTFDAIIDTLLSERRIELRNFGVFEVKRRKARKARNPRTGERVDVEPKFVVTFKPGKEMEERVRQLDKQAGAKMQTVPADDEGEADANGRQRSNP